MKFPSTMAILLFSTLFFNISSGKAEQPVAIPFFGHCDSSIIIAGQSLKCPEIGVAVAVLYSPTEMVFKVAVDNVTIPMLGFLTSNARSENNTLKLDVRKIAYGAIGNPATSLEENIVGSCSITQNTQKVFTSVTCSAIDNTGKEYSFHLVVDASLATSKPKLDIGKPVRSFNISY